MVDCAAIAPVALEVVVGVLFTGPAVGLFVWEVIKDEPIEYLALSEPSWPYMFAFVGTYMLGMLVGKQVHGCAVRWHAQRTGRVNLKDICQREPLDYNTLIFGLYLSLVFGAFAGGARRIQETPWSVAVWIGYYALFELAFACQKNAGNNFVLRMSCGAPGDQSPSWPVLLACMGAGVVLACGIFFFMFHVDAWVFAMSLSLFCTLVAAFVLFMSRTTSTHVHHWAWPIAFIHLCAFRGDAFMVVQAGLLAIHLHGLAVFNNAHVFGSAQSSAVAPKV